MSKVPVAATNLSIETTAETAVPTLRVMRLQSPELHHCVSGSLGNRSLLESYLCLPDSLSVHVGETFSAYLGILNTSTSWPIRQLSVSAQLQTPSQRRQLPSRLDSAKQSGGIDIEPQSGVDAIVSHAIEEPGQHILRVEVGYLTTEGGSKTFRKFYRFMVTSPLNIRHSAVRSGDDCCFVSLEVECNAATNSSGVPLVISDVDFLPVDGLSAVRIGDKKTISSDDSKTSALNLFDGAGVMMPGGSSRYLFRIEASAKQAVLRGIAAGDVLGKATFRWRKAMGETGQCYSPPIHCPPIEPSFVSSGTDQFLYGTSKFVVHRSGLSVDVASAAARNRPDALLAKLPVTVEPIDPPSHMELNVPKEVQFLVVNHSEHSMNLQFQLRLAQMAGLVVCGPSFRSLGEVSPKGGSTVVVARFLPLAAGLMRLQGCVVVDLVSGREIQQPPLFHVFVERPDAPKEATQ